jgi:hypothetical protein
MDTMDRNGLRLMDNGRWTMDRDRNGQNGLDGQEWTSFNGQWTGTRMGMDEQQTLQNFRAFRVFRGQKWVAGVIFRWLVSGHQSLWFPCVR